MLVPQSPFFMSEVTSVFYNRLDAVMVFVLGEVCEHNYNHRSIKSIPNPPCEIKINEESTPGNTFNVLGALYSFADIL